MHPPPPKKTKHNEYSLENVFTHLAVVLLLPADQMLLFVCCLLSSAFVAVPDLPLSVRDHIRKVYGSQPHF